MTWRKGFGQHEGVALFTIQNSGYEPANETMGRFILELFGPEAPSSGPTAAGGTLAPEQISPDLFLGRVRKTPTPSLCRHRLSKNSESDEVHDKRCDQALISASFSDRLLRFNTSWE